MARPQEFHWVFGNNDHINFTLAGGQLIPSAASNHSIQTTEGCATISDQNGDLIAYTDGISLWDRFDNTIYSGLGGNSSSTSSAIIVPPAGSGTDYHIFAINDDYSNGSADRVMHSTFRPIATPAIPPLPQLEMGVLPTALSDPDDNSERLAATSHVDCEKYWVLAQDQSEEKFFAYLVDGDNTPGNAVVSTTAQFRPKGAVAQGYTKFSPDGKILAWAGGRSGQISIHRFDNSTGVVSDYFVIEDVLTAVDEKAIYGLEFSPDSSTIYFSDLNNGTVYGYTLSSAGLANSIPFSDSTVMLNQTDLVGALQLGPDDVIYGKSRTQSNNRSLISISGSNDLANAIVDPSALVWNNPAMVDNGLGLPTFTRASDACASRVVDQCAQLADDVDAQLANQAVKHPNQMMPCDGSDSIRPQTDICEPLPLPDMKPQISISWGDSQCDCIESDDIEVVTITVCNPYSNIAFDHFTIHKLTVTDAQGNLVAEIPNGQPSIELVPVGPYCFGQIEACSCVSREFTLRMRGAISGAYRVKVDGVCFDVCMHFDQTACFTFDICED